MDNNIAVSVCIFTFNYERFLAEAIESVLAQQTSFAVEIVIGDDCSGDRTREIGKGYADRYPGKFVLSYNETNIGGTRNWIRTMNACRGKYIALLDGDDYFTDIHKLQKQYDALERNPEYVLSFHGVEEKYDDVAGQDKIVVFEKEEYTLADFLARGWFIRTASTFFRKDAAPAVPPDWVYDFPYRYDTILHVFLCMHGKAIFLKDVMSVWRKHSKGMSKTLMADVIRNINTEVALARALDRLTGFEYTKIVRKYIAGAYSDLFFRILRMEDRRRHIPALMSCLREMDYNKSFKIIQRKLSGGKTA